MATLREDADKIIKAALEAALPDNAVKKALEGHTFSGGRVRLVAAGKAAWQMAKTASEMLGSRIEAGVVVTKYGHSMGPSPISTSGRPATPCRTKTASGARRRPSTW